MIRGHNHVSLRSRDVLAVMSHDLPQLYAILFVHLAERSWDISHQANTSFGTKNLTALCTHGMSTLMKENHMPLTYLLRRLISPRLKNEKSTSMTSLI
jgi:hypothetical protein